ncbi:MAG TPA: fumarylacetoacetate hydrolase family protein [Fimbriimonadaceae bacterium]|nr:fumarylacetoacetate hydrolase family protein [Fimbriimonadaceae bacterium]
MKLVRIETDRGPVWAAEAEAEAEAGYVRVEWRDGEPVAIHEPAPKGKLLAPVDPPAILAIGVNYRKHAAETGAKLPLFPVVFQKGLHSLTGPEDPIVLPRHLRSDKVDYECELAFVFKKTAKNVSRAEAMDYVLGFTAANDVSARDWQREWGGTQWCKAKSFDSFCPCGPCVVTLDQLPNYGNLRITTKIDGNVMQDARTDDLIFDIPALVEFLTGSTTVAAGTLVLTGTPHGVGMARDPQVWLRPGNLVEVEIEGIGTLRNRVTEEVIG